MTLESSHTSLNENLRAVPIKSVSKAFYDYSIGAQPHADAAIDGITLRSLEVATSDGGGGSSKGEDVAELSAGSRSLSCC